MILTDHMISFKYHSSRQEFHVIMYKNNLYKDTNYKYKQYKKTVQVCKPSSVTMVTDCPLPSSIRITTFSRVVLITIDHTSSYLLNGICLWLLWWYFGVIIGRSARNLLHHPLTSYSKGKSIILKCFVRPLKHLFPPKWYFPIIHLNSEFHSIIVFMAYHLSTLSTSLYEGTLFKTLIVTADLSNVVHLLCKILLIEHCVYIITSY